MLHGPQQGQPEGHGVADCLVLVFVVTGYDYIKAERNDNNNANKLDTPLVVPHELIKVASQHFISDALNMYRPRLDQFWSEEEMDEIEAKQHNLIK